jgi:hypothetical protein
MFRRFLDATDYWFGCSDDSSTGSYDPARECYVVVANDQANGTGAVGAGDGEITPSPGIATRLAAGPSAPAGADADVQLAQARELEAKLAEEYRTVWLLHASMAGEAFARGERARELGKQVRDRINNVDNPDAPPRASQKLIAAATLLRAMPAPSTPRRETCTARCRISSSKRPSSRPRAQRHASANRGMRGTTEPHKGRTLGTRRRSGGATRQPRTHAGQGAAP